MFFGISERRRCDAGVSARFGMMQTQIVRSLVKATPHAYRLLDLGPMDSDRSDEHDLHQRHVSRAEMRG